MKPSELMIEKIYNSHIFPHKPKPLCSCWIGDKMVDMYLKFDFERYKVNWGRAYKGHSNNDDYDWIQMMEIIDDEDDEYNEHINNYKDVMWSYYLYLH